MRTVKTIFQEFMKDYRGMTFRCPRSPEFPGRNNSEIYFWSDFNWTGILEEIVILDTGDRLRIIDDPIESYEYDGKKPYFYRAKLIKSGSGKDYVDPKAFEEGKEFFSPYWTQELNASAHDESRRLSIDQQKDMKEKYSKSNTKEYSGLAALFNKATIYKMLKEFRE